ncbi:Alkaline ceramidase 3 [Haplosporangium sp. Z 11]|nr:Alkaline ceramidase 3 [Haplosporangium sp. Z 11]
MAPVSTAPSGSAFNKIGYWSPNTASVDWCESNYVMSFYIAEYWNTISNVASLLLVILGYSLFPTNEMRFKILFLTCGIVTIGSMLFHGTLRHKMQLLAVASIVFSTTGGKIQFYTFQSTYTILQFCMIYYLRVLHVQQCSKKPNPAISSFIHRALGFGALAVTIWLIDLRLSASVSSAFDKIGFWSPNTASVDWCESNYVVSFYIAEFWNTISNVACFFAAAVGYYYFPGNERRFWLLFATFSLVGLGSVLFHGTLRHKMQLLDELPMLYSATMILFILVEAKHGPQGRWFPVLLTAWIGFTTFIFSTTGGQLQFYTFQSTYTALQFAMIYFLRVLHVQQRAIRGPNPDVSILIRRAFASALFAVTIWLIDLRLCEFVNGVGKKSILRWNPQLHAWWHVFSACALYHATMLIVYYHYDIQNMRPFIDVVCGGWIPIIRLHRPKNKFLQ